MSRTKKQSPLLTPEDRIIELERQKDALTTENARLTATIDYVAMMADIDIPSEEEGTRNV